MIDILIILGNAALVVLLYQQRSSWYRPVWRFTVTCHLLTIFLNVAGLFRS